MHLSAGPTAGKAVHQETWGRIEAKQTDEGHYGQVQVIHGKGNASSWLTIGSNCWCRCSTEQTIKKLKREFANLIVQLTPWEMRIKKIESMFCHCFSLLPSHSSISQVNSDPSLPLTSHFCDGSFGLIPLSGALPDRCFMMANIESPIVFSYACS